MKAMRQRLFDDFSEIANSLVGFSEYRREKPARIVTKQFSWMSNWSERQSRQRKEKSLTRPFHHNVKMVWRNNPFKNYR